MLRVTIAALLLAAGTSALPASSRVVVGQPAPEFAVTTLDGGKMNIGDLRGKRVLVFMWASW